MSEDNIKRKATRARTIPSDRFWKRVDKSGGPDACWLWHGGISGGSLGYGVIQLFNQRFEYAHRYAYALAYGPFDPGLQVNHRCDTPACCNPNHLMLGTHASNAADMIAKGRARPRLRPEQVKEIVALHSQKGPFSSNLLADLFEVSEFAIREILSGKRWARVTGIGVNNEANVMA